MKPITSPVDTILHVCIQLIELLFAHIPGVKFYLSEKVLLEKIFGMQCQRGATNENPNAYHAGMQKHLSSESNMQTCKCEGQF